MPEGPSFWFDTRIYLAVAAALLFVISLYNHYVAALGAILLYVLYRYGKERFKDRQKALNEYLASMGRQVDESEVHALQNLPLAIAIVDETGILHWTNKVMIDWFGAAAEQGQSLLQLLPTLFFEKIWGKDGKLMLVAADRHLQIIHKSAEMAEHDDKRDALQILYIFDVTETENARSRCYYSQPVLAYIQIDNYDDVLKGLNDSRRTEIAAAVSQRLSEWVTGLEGFLKRYTEDMYFAVLSRQALEQAMTGDRFEILEQIRTIHGANNIPVTLSMGVAAEEISIAALGQQAQAGLDLALGRGGDQAAIHLANRFQFFGGKARAVEKNTRVKARIVAQALREIIENSTAVLVMGHAVEDFDSLGAALGVAKMVRFLGKPVHVAVSQPGQALDKLAELMPDYEEYSDLFINPSQAAAWQGSGLTVIVVDTHRPELMASPEAVAKSERVVVIDHHRRGATFPVNPLLVYLEPSSSSTSELVAELLMYFDENLELNRLEASALYAGLVVDTKSFAVQTGVRTFEAASYLRRAGADPSLIRHLFRVDFETARARSVIISAAEQPLPGVAMAVCPDDLKNMQMVAAQAADILLNIEGVRASFVLFPLEGGGAGISARSQGDINVQLLMEQLGGGGHQAVAGAQVKGMTVLEAKTEVIKLVMNYIKESETNEINSGTRSEKTR